MLPWSIKVTGLGSKNPDALFTVEEADKIISSIVDESLYFAGRW